MKLTTEQIQTRRKWADALQSSKRTISRLYNDKLHTHCCLGVYANSICGIDNALLKDWGTILDGVPNIPIDTKMQYLDAAGIVSESFFSTMNDFDLDHPDIGLYLYLTCEAGEAFEDFDIDSL